MRSAPSPSLSAWSAGSHHSADGSPSGIYGHPGVFGVVGGGGGGGGGGGRDGGAGVYGGGSIGSSMSHLPLRSGSAMHSASHSAAHTAPHSAAHTAPPSGQQTPRSVLGGFGHGSVNGSASVGDADGDSPLGSPGRAPAGMTVSRHNSSNGGGGGSSVGPPGGWGAASGASTGRNTPQLGPISEAAAPARWDAAGGALPSPVLSAAAVGSGLTPLLGGKPLAGAPAQSAPLPALHAAPAPDADITDLLSAMSLRRTHGESEAH
jgi:hypothetical protein